MALGWVPGAVEGKIGFKAARLGGKIAGKAGQYAAYYAAGEGVEFAIATGVETGYETLINGRDFGETLLQTSVGNLIGQGVARPLIKGLERGAKVIARSDAAKSILKDAYDYIDNHPLAWPLTGVRFHAVGRGRLHTDGRGTRLNPAFQKGFDSHRELVEYLGPAGKGRAWHHIVEQTPANVARFGARRIHNIANIVNLPHGAGSLHNKISGFYSSRAPGGGRIRDWLATKSFQKQYDFGVQTLGRFYEP